MQVYLRSSSKNIRNISMYLSFVMYLTEDGHMSDRNILQVHCVYNII